MRLYFDIKSEDFDNGYLTKKFSIKSQSKIIHCDDETKISN